MPLYYWECKTCGCSTEVIRSFDAYEEKPEPDELPEGSKCTSPGGEHDFKRLLGGKVHVVKGSGWGGGKGNW